jgi:antiviral helicase SKI2
LISSICAVRRAHVVARRTKKKDIYVISTPMRPVPLEHFLWAGKELHRIVDSKSKWRDEG